MREVVGCLERDELYAWWHRLWAMGQDARATDKLIIHIHRSVLRLCNHTQQRRSRPHRNARACTTSKGQTQSGELTKAHSHSIVAGGFEEMSYTTRLQPRTSLMILEDARASRS